MKTLVRTKSVNPGGTMSTFEHDVTMCSLKQILDKDLGCHAYAEVGVWQADTSVQIAAELAHSGEKNLFLGVDIDKKAEGHWNEKVTPWTEGSYLRAQFYTGDSRDLSNKVSELAWVLIDACHCFECVDQDIKNWAHRLVKGGYAVFHDSAPRRQAYRKLSQHNRTRRFGVYEALQRSKLLKTQFKHILHLDEIDGNGLDIYERL